MKVSMARCFSALIPTRSRNRRLKARFKYSRPTRRDTLIARGGEFTPTPAVSHAILAHNRGRTSGLADGIVVTPSHNPPDNGGFKYNTPNGGPADTRVTRLD